MKRTRGLASEVRAALPGWVAARVLVVAAWFASRLWIEHRRNGVRPDASLFGLFAWDGTFYRGLAQHGYSFEATEALRFFPLYSLLGRLLDYVTQIGPGTALLVIANVCALLAGGLVYRLARMESDRRTAQRSALLFALVPSAFVLTFAYAEALFVLLAALTFVGLRRERWWMAAIAGFLAGLTRPTGVFLALAAAVEAGRGIRNRRVGELPARAVAVLAPLAGAATYLWWVDREFGDWKLPLRLQTDLRGDVANPIIRVGQAASDLVHLDKHGLHFPFAIALIVLTVVVFQRLPASYGMFSAAIVVTSLASENLNSIERYGLNAFPLVIALAMLVPSRTAERVTVVVCGAGLFGLCALAWLGIYVP
ncbi:MAG TPA: mannosyltransferase family protein [Acidimicrobiales bacterium]